MSRSEVEYSIFYGIPHAHTGLSTGKGSPLEAFIYAKEKGLDFLIITDHIEDLKKDHKWNKLCEDCKVAKEKIEKFLPIIGYEVRLQNKIHINVIEPKTLLYREYYDFDTIVDHAAYENSIIALNHPSFDIEGILLNNKSHKNVQLIEVANGLFRGGRYKSYDDIYYNILDKGMKLGVLNSQDNHGKNWGDNENVTAVVARSLRKEDILEALKERRTYSTECRGVYIKFALNEKWMGSSVKVKKGEELKFKIRVSSPLHNINKLSIITNGGKEVSSLCLQNVGEVQWKPVMKNIICPAYYLLKVNFGEKAKAITSAIYVKN